MIECADPELILQLVCIILHPNCIPTRFPNFSEFSVAVPRIGTGSEVGLCVDAAEKLDKKALRNPGRYVNRQSNTAWRTFTDASTDRTR